MLDYYGYENEVRRGLKATPVDKPEPLVRYEMVNTLGIPLVEGGVLDQPHIYLMEYAIVHRVKSLIDAMREQENHANSSQKANGIQ